MRLLASAFAILLGVGTARAESVRVVVDIAPVHSLVAQVMDGLGEPALLLPPYVSPHYYALKPSQARLLSNADLVIWVGEGLTPWLESSVGTLAGDAQTLELLDLDALVRLPARGRDERGDHNHDSHDHRALDPHLWLDPENARILVGVLADALAVADPENAALYRANAQNAALEIQALISETETTLSGVKDTPFITFHDAYQYFEARFGLTSAGSVALSDAATPGARRISEIRAILRQTKAKCAFAEPQFPERSVSAILRGTDTRLGTLDPMGFALKPGPALYGMLIRGLTVDPHRLSQVAGAAVSRRMPSANAPQPITRIAAQI